MNEQIKNALRCPLCGAAFELGNQGKSLLCLGETKKHCYDLSSSGYVNFAPPSQSRSGDSREAVRSRTDFLNGGFYEPIREAVKEAIGRYAHGIVIDAGCGEGYYSSMLIEVADGVIGFDLSKFGIETAAKRTRGTENSFFGVAGIYDMPVTCGCAGAVVNIFAPCATEEFKRVLQEGGVLVVVGAGKDHLLGLKRAIYETAYENTQREDMPLDMTLLAETRVSYDITLSDPKEIANLFSMTPYYYRTGEKDMKKLKELESITTPIDVFVQVYKR